MTSGRYGSDAVPSGKPGIDPDNPVQQRLAESTFQVSNSILREKIRDLETALKSYVGKTLSGQQEADLVVNLGLILGYIRRGMPVEEIQKKRSFQEASALLLEARILYASLLPENDDDPDVGPL